MPKISLGLFKWFADSHSQDLRLKAPSVWLSNEIIGHYHPRLTPRDGLANEELKKKEDVKDPQEYKYIEIFDLGFSFLKRRVRQVNAVLSVNPICHGVDFPKKDESIFHIFGTLH